MLADATTVDLGLSHRDELVPYCTVLRRSFHCSRTPIDLASCEKLLLAQYPPLKKRVISGFLVFPYNWWLIVVTLFLTNSLADSPPRNWNRIVRLFWGDFPEACNRGKDDGSNRNLD